LTTLLTLISARIASIALPRTLKSNSTTTLHLLTENYIQGVSEISIAIGFAPSPGYPSSLGRFISSAYLGPNKSNTLETILVPVHVPAAEELGTAEDVVGSAALLSLYGAVAAPMVRIFNVTVGIGEEES
ncbi:hypothetical protein GQ43DRAFT_359354, partial [Delitschia confertaspora ATCC 74209]